MNHRDTETQSSPLLEASGIQRSFGGVPVLKGVSLRVNRGETHAVVGENGAGKSTLMRILTGALPADSGIVTWSGVEPRRIGLVHQEPMLAPHLTVAENLFLGREPARGWTLDTRAQLAQARQFLAAQGIALDAEGLAGRLNAAQKQTLELARALAADPELLILDEPTSSLSDAESRAVLERVERFRATGHAAIYISHRLEEVRAAAGQVTILRDGECVHSGPLAELSNADVIRHMAGRALHTGRRAAKRSPGEVALRVEGEGMKLEVRAGEVVGLAGLIGAGRTELCLTLFGLAPAPGWRVEVLGRPVSIANPSRAMAAGLAYLPEDRQHSGIFRGRPLRENISISALPSAAGWLRLGAESAKVARLTERLGVRGRPEQAMETLSGGNQQKALLARWMMTGARVFLLDEPTRGIDVAAKADVFALMDELAAHGAAILMVSSETQELLEVCDRLLVMKLGRLVQELDPATTTREEVLRWAL